MSINIKVPISTEVIELNPDCEISGSYEEGVLVLTIDTRNQNIHKRLNLGTKVRLHFGKENSFEVQELSSMQWPIRYLVLTREGYYIDDKGTRKFFVTKATGIDNNRHVSQTLMRASVLLLVIAGMGYRQVSWLLKILFHVEVSKSSLQRWVGEVASQLPSGDQIIELLNKKQEITEGHLDEIFPRGMDHCVLVLKDEHGRVLTTKSVESRDEANVKPFLQHMKDLGINFKSFYIDGCKAYFNSIRAVFGEKVSIQYDYFHIIQNCWRHLWKWSVSHRRDIKSRSEKVSSPKYKVKLSKLATSLWENRYLLFKSEKRMSDKEQEKLIEILEADNKIGILRSFLGGIWNIFENSKDYEEAVDALSKLKQKEIDSKYPERFEKVINFISDNFEWMTAFLRTPKVKRNSLAETTMRVLRRLELNHDGFRSENGRENFLRIYQAIKYLGWNVYDPAPESLKSNEG